MSNIVFGTAMIVVPVCMLFGIALWVNGWEDFKEMLISLLVIVISGALLICIMFGVISLLSGR